MSEKISAEVEALQFAIETEKKGYRFYRVAAESTSDPKGKEVFSQLARDEIEHMCVFTTLYTSLTNDEAWLTYEEALEKFGEARPDEEIFPDGPVQGEEGFDDMKALQEALEFDAARRDLQDEQSQSQQQKMWARIHEGLQEVIRTHDARTEDLLDGFSERMQQWQEALEQSSQSVESQLQKLADYTDRLSQLAEQGDQLGRVELKLADNLEAVRAAETFEETLHNLTAAVHMLTARAKPRAA